MEFIKYEGLKNIFFGLAKEKERYFLVYGKTETPTINMEQENVTVHGKFNIELMSIPTDIYTYFSIPMTQVIQFIEIKDEKEYDRIISIIKRLSYE